MMSHGIISARYAEPKPSTGYASDAMVIVTHVSCREQHRHANDDNEGGGMRAFLDQGGTIEPYRKEYPPLEEMRAAAIRQLNALAEAKRLTFITPGSAQAMTYQEKLAEARLILVDDVSRKEADSMDESTLRHNFPMTWASLGIDGRSASEVAEKVQAAALAWSQIGAAIENRRALALDAIKIANEQEAIERVLTNLEWGV